MISENIQIKPAAITKILGIILIVVVIANLVACFPYMNKVADIHGIGRVFSLDGERNIPTAYNVFLLLVPAALLAFITYLHWKQTGKFSWYWAILAFGFTFMSMDEAWTIHEDIIDPLKEKLGNKNGTHHLGLLYNAWVLPGLGVVLLVAISYIRFLMKLPRKIAIAFFVSGVIYVTGALVIEALDGAYEEVHGNNFIYKMMTTVEETMEMLGLILFIKALLEYLALTYSDIKFTLVPKAPRQKRIT